MAMIERGNFQETAKSDITRMLLVAGASLTARDNDKMEIPLMYAARKNLGAVIGILAEAGSDLNAQDKNGGTALAKAAYMGHEAAVESLLEHGASTRPGSPGDAAPLGWAAHAGHTAVVRHLLKAGSNAQTRDNRGFTALDNAQQAGHYATIKLLQDWQACRKDHGCKTTLLNSAIPVYDGKKAFKPDQHESMVNSKDKDEIDKHSGTMTSLQEATVLNDEAAVIELLRHGANVDARSAHASTALILASAKGHHAIARLLLKKGAGVNANNYELMSALAVASHQLDRKLLGMLIQHGTDVNVQNINGETPLMLAAKDAMYAVTSSMRRVKCRPRASVVKRLLEAGARLDFVDKDGFTALHHASVATACDPSDRAEVVSLLIDANPSQLQARDLLGNTPQKIASEQTKQCFPPEGN